MTMQELRPGGRAAGRERDGSAAAPEGAGGRGEAARQREIFEARREELLAAHPGRYIAVCAGEVFAADTVMEATHAASRAHPGRAAFFYSPGYGRGILTGEEATWLAERGFYVRVTPSELAAEAARIKRHNTGVARGEREAARQRRIFEARREELLAAHPGRHIAVCAGEVFAADTVTEAAQMAARAHPGRAAFFYSPGCAIVDLY